MTHIAYVNSIHTFHCTLHMITYGSHFTLHMCTEQRVKWGAYTTKKPQDKAKSRDIRVLQAYGAARRPGVQHARTHAHAHTHTHTHTHKPRPPAAGGGDTANAQHGGGRVRCVS